MENTFYYDLPYDVWDPDPKRREPAGNRAKRLENWLSRPRPVVINVINNAERICEVYKTLVAAAWCKPEVKIKSGLLTIRNVDEDKPQNNDYKGIEIYLDDQLVFRYSNQIEVLKAAPWIIELYHAYCDALHKEIEVKEMQILDNIDFSEWNK